MLLATGPVRLPRETTLRAAYEDWLEQRPNPEPLLQGGECSADLIEQWADATGRSGVDVEAVLDSYAAEWVGG